MRNVGQLVPSGVRSWTFITNHAQVLLTLARNPEASVAEVAQAARITERTAYRVLADLQQAGYLRRGKIGRHNSYEINSDLPLGDPTVENELVGDLVALASKDRRKRDPEPTEARPRAMDVSDRRR